jgi:hypothetical protein
MLSIAGFSRRSRDPNRAIMVEVQRQVAARVTTVSSLHAALRLPAR